MCHPFLVIQQTGYPLDNHHGAVGVLRGGSPMEVGIRLKKHHHEMVLPSRSFTARPWRRMVGRQSSPFGIVYFQGRTVKLPGGITEFMGEIPSLKLTARAWKWMVGRWNSWWSGFDDQVIDVHHVITADGVIQWCFSQWGSQQEARYYTLGSGKWVSLQYYLIFHEGWFSTEPMIMGEKVIQPGKITTGHAMEVWFRWFSCSIGWLLGSSC